jgi:hypothetical protein
MISTSGQRDAFSVFAFCSLLASGGWKTAEFPNF